MGGFFFILPKIVDILTGNQLEWFCQNGKLSNVKDVCTGYVLSVE